PWIFTFSLHDALPIWQGNGLSKIVTSPTQSTADGGNDSFSTNCFTITLSNGEDSNPVTASLSSDACTLSVGAEGKESILVGPFIDRKSTRLNSSHVKI